jgi:peptidoglycan lytic transglycosylase
VLAPSDASGSVPEAGRACYTRPVFAHCLVALALIVAGLAIGPRPVGAKSATAASDAGLQRYRDGQLALAAGELERARTLFESVPSTSLLGDYAAFYAAEALLRAGEEPLAVERFRSFLERFTDSTLIPQALLALTDTAFRSGRWAEAERDARRFLARSPSHPEAARILVRLAQARAAQGQVAEAMADLRRRWIETPASPWGQIAREVMGELSSRYEVPIAPLGGEERLLQAQRFVDASDFQGAVRVLEELLAQAPETALRHRGLILLAPALGRVQRGPEGIALLEAALAEPPGPGRAAILYELARLYRRAGQPAQAAATLERLIAEHPDAPVLAEAWLALARARNDVGDGEGARAALRTLVKTYPDAPAAASAQWELAWILYRGGKHREAAQAFRQLSASGPTFRLAGLYWSGRALDAAGDKSAAGALYREVVSRAPHTYYGIVAARRLRGPAPVPVAAPVRLPADPIATLEGDIHFQKSRALWRLGFEGHALVELETLGRDSVVEPDRALGLGVAFAQIGESGRSLRHLRRAFGGAAEAGAAGLTDQFWRLFYPFGYPDIVREAARRAGLDPFFVAAVIREESSYDARARSWVGAVGLMQLMPETARLVAAETGIRLTEPAGLWEPPVNIGLGAHYLAQLRSRFREPLLAVASYNAGPHRVQRWLTQIRSADLEEFVDQIPFDETRAFVKRVYASWHHYRRLYNGPEKPARRGEAEATVRTR